MNSVIDQQRQDLERRLSFVTVEFIQKRMEQVTKYIIEVIKSDRKGERKTEIIESSINILQNLYKNYFPNEAIVKADFWCHCYELRTILGMIHQAKKSRPAPNFQPGGAIPENGEVLINKSGTKVRPAEYTLNFLKNRNRS